MNNEHSLTIL